MDERLQKSRLLARATFGARPGDRERLEAEGARAWLARELLPGADPALEQRLGAFGARSFDPVAFIAGVDLPRGGEQSEKAMRARRELRRRTREVSREMAGVRLVRAVHGEHGPREVLIDFWANHFNVFGRKGLIGGLLPHYQRDVLERFALARFEDLLIAVAESPAMLVYLDNWLSTAPRGRVRRRVRRGGINENYARELLELHTVGVHGGYTQQDVVEVARVFTGWTLESRRKPVFRFRERLHDPGPKRVMGEPVRGDGRQEGLGLLRRLARHPSTARFVSAKLARRFVADDPPPALVERAAVRFLETQGEIRQVVATILLSPEFADAEQRKLKTPLRFTASALRATGGETDGSARMLLAQARVGELPYFARAPTGHPEEMAKWVDPGALLERMALAFALAHGHVRGTRLGSELPPGTAVANGETADRRQRVALALAAPEFQWA